MQILKTTIKDIKKAITLKNTNVRVLPTNSPMFYNPSLPGEGFSI